MNFDIIQLLHVKQMGKATGKSAFDRTLETRVFETGAMMAEWLFSSSLARDRSYWLTNLGAVSA